MMTKQERALKVAYLEGTIKGLEEVAPLFNEPWPPGRIERAVKMAIMAGKIELVDLKKDKF